jgi:hypothetical protein
MISMRKSGRFFKLANRRSSKVPRENKKKYRKRLFFPVWLFPVKSLTKKAKLSTGFEENTKNK